MNKKDTQTGTKSFVKPSRNKHIGRRTGVNVKQGKNIRKFKDGYENFDDYWTESEADSICDESLYKKPVTNKENVHIKNHVSTGVENSTQDSIGPSVSFVNGNKNLAYLRNKNIGRRTGQDVKAGKDIRRFKDGFENFDDYWSESDADSILSSFCVNRRGSAIEQQKSQHELESFETEESDGSCKVKTPATDKKLSDVDDDNGPITVSEQDTAEDDTDTAEEPVKGEGDESHTPGQPEKAECAKLTASEQANDVGDVYTASEQESIEDAPITASEQESVEDAPSITSGQTNVEDAPSTVSELTNVEDNPVTTNEQEHGEDGPSSASEQESMQDVSCTTNTQHSEGPASSIADLQTRKEKEKVEDDVTSTMNHQEMQKKHLAHGSQGKKGQSVLSSPRNENSVVLRDGQENEDDDDAAATATTVDDVQSASGHPASENCVSDVTESCLSSHFMQPTQDEVPDATTQTKKSCTSQSLKVIKSGQKLNKSLSDGKNVAKKQPDGTVVKSTHNTVNSAGSAKKQCDGTAQNDAINTADDVVSTNNVLCQSGNLKLKQNLNNSHVVNKSAFKNVENTADIDKTPGETTVQVNNIESMSSGKIVAKVSQSNTVSKSKQNGAEKGSSNQNCENLTQTVLETDKDTNKKRLKTVSSKSNKKLSKKRAEEKCVQVADTESSTIPKTRMQNGRKARASDSSVLVEQEKVGDDEDFECGGNDSFKGQNNISTISLKHHLPENKSLELNRLETGIPEKTVNRNSVPECLVIDNENKDNKQQNDMRVKSGTKDNHCCEPVSQCNLLSNSEKFETSSNMVTVSVNDKDWKTSKAVSMPEIEEDDDDDDDETPMNSQQSDSETEDEDTPTAVAVVTGVRKLDIESVSDEATSKSDSPASKLIVGGNVTGSLTKNEDGFSQLTNPTSMLSFRTRKRLSYSLIHDTSIPQKKTQEKTKKQQNKTLNSECLDSSETDTNMFLCLSRKSLGNNRNSVLSHKEDDYNFLIVDDDSDNGVTVKEQTSKRNTRTKSTDTKKGNRKDVVSKKQKPVKKANMRKNCTESDTESEIIKQKRNVGRRSSELNASSGEKHMTKNKMSKNKAKEIKTKTNDEEQLPNKSNKIKVRRLSNEEDEPEDFVLSDSEPEKNFDKNKKSVKKSKKTKAKSDVEGPLPKKNNNVKLKRLSNEEDEPEDFSSADSEPKNMAKNKMSANKAKKTKTKSENEEQLPNKKNKIKVRRLSNENDEPEPFALSDSEPEKNMAKNKKSLKKSKKTKAKSDDEEQLPNKNNKVKGTRLSKDDGPEAFGHSEPEDSDPEKNLNKNKKSLKKSKTTAKSGDEEQLPNKNNKVKVRRLSNEDDEPEDFGHSDLEPEKNFDKNKKSVKKSKKAKSNDEKDIVRRLSDEPEVPALSDAGEHSKDDEVLSSSSSKAKKTSSRVPAKTKKPPKRKGKKVDDKPDTGADMLTNSDLPRTDVIDDVCADIKSSESHSDSTISPKRKRKYSSISDTSSRAIRNTKDRTKKSASKLSKQLCENEGAQQSDSSDHRTTDSTAESVKSGPSKQKLPLKLSTKKLLRRNKLSKKKNTKESKKSLTAGSELQEMCHSPNLSVHDSIRHAMTLPLEVPQSGVSLHSRSFTSTSTSPNSSEKGKRSKGTLLQRRLTTCLVQPGSVQSKEKKQRRVTINKTVERTFISPTRGSTSQHSSLEDSTCQDSIVHFAEVTTSATPTSVPGPKKEKIIFPKSAPEGLRRSQRTRVQTLEWYKNERVIYDRRKSGCLITGIQPSLEQKYLQMQKVRRLKKPKGLRRLSKGRLLHPTNLSMHVDLPEDIDLTCSSDVPILNPDSQEEMMLRCFSKNEHFESITPSDDDGEENSSFLISYAVRQPMVNSGNMILLPLAEKKSQIVASQILCFCVIYGKISVTIHRATCIVETGNHFFIPRGNSYSLKNLRKEDAKLAFFNFTSLTEKD